MEPSRTLHGCVDWNIKWTWKTYFKNGRTLHGCVDWNIDIAQHGYFLVCRTLHGCVDWNIIGKIDQSSVFIVAPYTGAWIEIRKSWYREESPVVAPYTGAWIEMGYMIETSYDQERRTLHGCVDWNKNYRGKYSQYWMSHPTRVRGLKL